MKRKVSGNIAASHSTVFMSVEFSGAIPLTPSMFHQFLQPRLGKSAKLAHEAVEGWMSI